MLLSSVLCALEEYLNKDKQNYYSSDISEGHKGMQQKRIALKTRLILSLMADVHA